MEKYVLSYFNYRGRAEAIRLMLIDHTIPFAEHTIHEKEWASLRTSYPFLQVPTLRIDGHTTIAQTGAIMRYFGRKLATMVDVLFEATRDWRNRYQRLIYEEYEEQKTNYIDHYLPKQIANFEKIFATRGYEGPYLLGKKLSIADYALFEELCVSKLLAPDCMEYINRRSIRSLPVNGNGKQ
ncbi:unnamed protein product, partial [Mesorhabditis spiculigera]